ncbi:MAG: O-acetyl-ADP-ribose deacetylase [Planctomycetota bacterium]|nr:MAG: O-acetyl-ADP-ribose deacetylase [Planctomycetota bacterium]
MIELHLGDITELATDAIVNAANARMLGGGGVDGAIHRAAGAALLEACRALPEVEPNVRCPPGQARLLPGGNLKARHVIATVGPVWKGGTCGEDETLAQCYRSCLQLAEEHRLESIAFPAISTGAYGFPIERAARIALREIRAHLHKADFPSLVVCVLFNKADHDVYRAILEE